METWADWLNPPVVWFIIGFILILLEFGIPGLITLFFGIGAWIVAILCLFIDVSIDMQLIIFITISIVSLIFLRQHFKKLFERKMDKSKFGDDELEEFIGYKAEVKKEIAPNKSGKVEFHGTLWKAESDEKIGKSEVVEIIEKKNLTLIVKSLKKEA
jgi:membrane protein implicated in regulation of membrane protease activity